MAANRLRNAVKVTPSQGGNKIDKLEVKAAEISTFFSEDSHEDDGIMISSPGGNLRIDLDYLEEEFRSELFYSNDVTELISDDETKDVSN